MYSHVPFAIRDFKRYIRMYQTWTYFFRPPLTDFHDDLLSSRTSGGQHGHNYEGTKNMGQLKSRTGFWAGPSPGMILLFVVGGLEILAEPHGTIWDPWVSRTSHIARDSRPSGPNQQLAMAIAASRQPLAFMQLNNQQHAGEVKRRN